MTCGVVVAGVTCGGVLRRTRKMGVAMFPGIFFRISGSEICASRYFGLFPELPAAFPDAKRDVTGNVNSTDTLAKRLVAE